MNNANNVPAFQTAASATKRSARLGMALATGFSALTTLNGCVSSDTPNHMKQGTAELIDVNGNTLVDDKGVPQKFTSNIFCWTNPGMGTRMCGLASAIDYVNHIITFSALVPTVGPERGAVDVGLGIFNAATNALLVGAEWKQAMQAFGGGGGGGGGGGAPISESSIVTDVRIGRVTGGSAIGVNPTGITLIPGGLHP